MTFKQHVPSFVDTDTPPVSFAFERAAELLAHPWVAQWKDDAGFVRYSVEDYTSVNALLMAEFDGGRRWHVLGYLRPSGEALALDLPRWVHPVDRAPEAAV